MERWKGRRIRIIVTEPLEAMRRNGELVLITGFPGFGAVGYITTRYIVEAMKLKRIGYVITKYMPDVVSIEGDRRFSFPHEIYSKEGSGLIVLVNSIVPNIHERVEFAESIVRWSIENKINEIILIGGLDPSVRRSQDDILRWTGNSWGKRVLKEPTMDRGLIIVGPLAIILMFTEILGQPATVILPYAERERPDPRAASVAVKKISEIFGVEIDIQDLIKHAETMEEIERKIREHMEIPEKRVTGYHM
ncbi:MAG TPA: PAC2 family protein [Sulfolobales archaeon]|nr:PAC2 family protein [Sulfolobales archaeon]